VAFALAIEADDLDRAAAIARNSWFEVPPDNAAGVIALVGSLPLSRIRRYPFLALVLALAFNTSGMHRVRAMEMFALAIASAHLMAGRAEPVDRLFLLTLQSVALRIVGQAERAQNAAGQALHLLDELPVDAVDEIGLQLPMLLSHLGLTLLYTGRIDDAVNAFQRSYALAGRSPRAARRAMVLAALAQAWAGDIVEAEQLLAQLRVRPISSATGSIASAPEPAAAAMTVDAESESLYHAAEAFVALERFDLASAQVHISAGQVDLESAEHWPVMLHLQAMMDLALGRAEAAGMALESAMTRPGSRRVGSPFVRALLASAQAAAFQAAGHPSRADAVLAALPRSCSQWTIAARGRSALVSGRPELAVRLLTDDMATFRAGPPRLRAEAYLLAAAAASRIARPATALACMERASGLMADRGLRFALMLIPRGDLDVLIALAVDRNSAVLPELMAGLVIPSALPYHARIVSLTERESVVLAQLARTGNAAEIAAALFVSVNTVKSQLRSIYRKLDAGTREQALLVAREAELLGDEGYQPGGTAEADRSRRPA
jgi:LuxR family maltose regulon positive regulatory protein